MNTIKNGGVFEMADVTAVILTKNEEVNISDCIRSISGFVRRIVVVDSGSTDGTVRIAKELGAEVYEHPYTYYAAQFNWGLENTGISTSWAMRIDADERFTPELCEECEELLKKADREGYNGIAMDAYLYFLGRVMKHGLANRRKIILFRYGIGSMEDRKRDPQTVLSEGTCLTARNRFIHHDSKDIGHYITKYNWYSIREKQDYFAYLDGASQEVNTERRLQIHRKNKFNIYYKAPKFIRAWLWFVYNYIFKLGFLDGREGYIYHWLECYWYRFLVDAKIYEQEKNGRKVEDLKGLGE